MKKIVAILLITMFACTIAYAEGEKKDNTKKKSEVTIDTTSQGTFPKLKGGC